MKNQLLQDDISMTLKTLKIIKIRNVETISVCAVVEWFWRLNGRCSWIVWVVDGCCSCMAVVVNLCLRGQLVELVRG